MESIFVEDRKKVELKGATRVISSTNAQAVVEIGNCNVVISGNNIEVTKLDLDNHEVNFAGEIASIKYTNKSEKVGLIKRLFK